MKHFRIPEDIHISPWPAVLATNPAAKPERMSFHKFASFVWLDDQRAYTDARGEGSIVKMRRWGRVIGVFESGKPGAWVSLDDEDFTALKKIVEAPTRFFPVPITIACLAFSDAVLAAVDELPVVVNGKAEADAASS
jgi:hypothetical protein